MDLAQLQRLLQPLFPGLMGVQLTEATPTRVVATMLVRPDLCTAGGILHGGAHMAFADTLGAVGTVLNLPAGRRTTTTDSSTKFIAGAAVGTVVTGEAWPCTGAAPPWSGRPASAMRMAGCARWSRKRNWYSTEIRRAPSRLTGAGVRRRLARCHGHPTMSA